MRLRGVEAHGWILVGSGFECRPFSQACTVNWSATSPASRAAQLCKDVKSSRCFLLFWSLEDKELAAVALRTSREHSGSRSPGCQTGPGRPWGQMDLLWKPSPAAVTSGTPQSHCSRI